ncbi:hypothetical protein H0X32_03465 [Patescibacteria group bacterium]|nr:hypothetical protein [Patescibacteria group bacterium]
MKTSKRFTSRSTIATIFFVLSPFLVHAQTPPATGITFAALVGKLVTLVNTSVLPLLYALAFVFFLFGLVRFFFIGGEEGREKGKQLMLYGLIGLFVLFSVWGIVNVLLTVFGTLGTTH